jgi:hypothetical protein
MKRCGTAAFVFLALAAVGDNAARAQQAQPQAFTFQGDIALWTMAIKPDKTADFEKVMTKLQEALSKSQKPERGRQLAGWKVMKIETPLPDGNIAYVHVIHPVVPGADYTIMQTLYDELPDERQALYELYRGAFAKNLSLATGRLTLDMAKTPQAAGAPTP